MTSTHDLRGMLRAARRRHMRAMRKREATAAEIHVLFAAWHTAFHRLAFRLRKP